MPNQTPEQKARDRIDQQLEASFKQAKPRALAQMATGSGKTYTAVTATYRLLKHAGAKRILQLIA